MIKSITAYLRNSLLYFLGFGCNLESTGTGKALGSFECKLLEDGHALCLTLYLPYLPFDLNMSFFACDVVSFHLLSPG